jgi:HK97 family phage prohead protease
MSNSTMKSEFPKQDQRVAVCNSLFEKKRASLPMEMQAFDLELRTDDEGEGTFEGHAAIFDKVNSHREIVKRGAFKESVTSRGLKGIKMFFGHDRNMPIGKWTEIREDKKGLFVRGQLLMQLEKAKEAFLLMREEILDGLSIGFRIVEDSFDRENEQIILHKIDLREVSLVTMPSASEALITKVRDASPEEVRSERELEKVLRDAGFSRAFSQYIVAGWTPPALRDAEGGTQLVESIRGLTASLQKGKPNG